LRRKAGNSNEKDNGECGALSSADVFGSDSPGTRRRRCAGGLIGCRGAWADWCRRRCCHRLYGRPVDFEFMGPKPFERAAPGAESREPGRSCPCKRPSACAQSVCAPRSSSSSSGCPSTAARHHHGLHRAAGPGTGVSRYHHRARGFDPASLARRFKNAAGLEIPCLPGRALSQTGL
jgi:hypothetical protein